MSRMEPDERLDPRLEYSIRQLRAMPPRSPSAAARGRARFLAQARELPARKTWSALFSIQRPFAVAPVIVVFVIVILGATGITAFAAEDSLPNTPLYPVKLFTEDARISLASQPDAKLDLALAFADRRLAEIATLGNAQSAPADAVANRMEQELNQALRIAVELPDAERPKALEKIQARLKKQTQKATEIESNPRNTGQGAAKRVNSMIDEQMQLIEMGKSDPPGLKKKFQEPQKQVEPAVTGTTPTVEKEQHQNTPPGQERKDSPEQKNPGETKGKENGNGNGKK